MLKKHSPLRTRKRIDVIIHHDPTYTLSLQIQLKAHATDMQATICFSPKFKIKSNNTDIGSYIVQKVLSVWAYWPLPQIVKPPQMHSNNKLRNQRSHIVKTLLNEIKLCRQSNLIKSSKSKHRLQLIDGDISNKNESNELNVKWHSQDQTLSGSICLPPVYLALFSAGILRRPMFGRTWRNQNLGLIGRNLLIPCYEIWSINLLPTGPLQDWANHTPLPLLHTAKWLK